MLQRIMWEKNVMVKFKIGWDAWINFNNQMKKVLEDDQDEDEDY